jgi:tetratricopeptide (TPR) repeat protein
MTILYVLCAVAVGAEDYACFSLRAALASIERNGTATEDVTRLGYITDPIAVVADRQTGDCILVGLRDPAMPQMYADDFAVALRYVFLHEGEESPGVSLENLSVGGEITKCMARYFGHVEDTHFGQVCFAADYLLKWLSLGLSPTGSAHVVSPWRVALARRPKLEPDEDEAPSKPAHQFFYPWARVISGTRSVVLEACRMSVMDERAADTVGTRLREEETDGIAFSQSMSDYFDEAARAYPIMENLRSLMKLVALAKGLKSSGLRPDLSYWLSGYAVKRVETPRFVRPVRQGIGGLAHGASVSGGVRLKGLAIRVAAGDPDAIADAVLLCRPSDSALTWSVRLSDEGVVPPSNSEDAAVMELLLTADYLRENGDNKGSIARFTAAMDLAGASCDALCGRARAYLGAGDVSKASADCDRAAGMDPNSDVVWAVRSLIDARIGKRREAIQNAAHAVGLNPSAQLPRMSRASLLADEGRYADALADLDTVLAINPSSAPALVKKGELLWGLRDHAGAVRSWSAATDVPCDSASYWVALNGIEGARAERRIPAALIDSLGLPAFSPAWSKQLLLLSASSSTRGEASSVYLPGEYYFGGRQGEFGLSANVGSKLVVLNRIGLELAVPLDAAVVPYTLPARPYDSKLGATASVTGSGVVAAQWLMFAGLWRRPSLSANVRLYTPSISRAFWSEEQLRSYTGAASDKWSGYAGLDANVPLSLSTELRATGGYWPTFSYDLSQAATVELSLAIFLDEKLRESTLRVSSAYTYSTNTVVDTFGVSHPWYQGARFGVTLERGQRRAWDGLGCGFGFHDWSSDAKRYWYVFFSYDIGRFAMKWLWL